MCLRDVHWLTGTLSLGPLLLQWNENISESVVCEMMVLECVCVDVATCVAPFSVSLPPSVSDSPLSSSVG